MAVSLKQLMQTSPMPRCEQQDATSRRRSCRPTPRGRCGKSRLAQRSGGRCEQRVTFCQNERQPACQNEMMTVTQALEKIGAGEGNRTLVISLEGCCSTIELHPRTRSSTCEPAFAKASAGAFATGRLASRSAAGAKAGGGGRTRTYEGVSQRIYSPPPLPLGTLPRTSHPRGCMVSPGYGERVGRCQPRQIRPRQR